MSEQDPNTYTWIGGALLSIGSWIGMRQVKRIDDLEKFQGQCVTRPELNGKLNRIEDKVDRLITHFMGHGK